MSKVAASCSSSLGSPGFSGVLASSIDSFWSFSGSFRCLCTQYRSCSFVRSSVCCFGRVSRCGLRDLTQSAGLADFFCEDCAGGIASWKWCKSFNRQSGATIQKWCRGAQFWRCGWANRLSSLCSLAVSPTQFLCLQWCRKTQKVSCCRSILRRRFSLLNLLLAQRQVF